MKARLSTAAALTLLAASLLLPTGCATISGGDALVIAVESAPKSLDPRLGSIDSVSARLHQIVRRSPGPAWTGSRPLSLMN